MIAEPNGTLRVHAKDTEDMPLQDDTQPWLIVIDMQVAFRDTNSPWACEGYTEIEPLITKLSPRFDGHVVTTRFAPEPYERGQWAKYYDRYPTMRRPESDHIWDLTIDMPVVTPSITQPTFSKWGADLAAVVGDAAPLVMCGVATECCILATALAAADAGREVIVLSDATRGATAHDHQQALSILDQMAPLITVCESSQITTFEVARIGAEG